jgi:hypothetical protein
MKRTKRSKRPSAHVVSRCFSVVLKPLVQVINDSFMPAAKCQQCEANQITSKVTMQVSFSSSASAAAATAAAASLSLFYIITHLSRPAVQSL